MFESAELGHKVSKAVWKKEISDLREGLLDAQLDLLTSKKFPVILLVAGVDCAGKGETVNILNEWMDPRHIETHALRDLTDEERERPRMYRYWRVLPPKGKIGIFIGTWYSTSVAFLAQPSPQEPLCDFRPFLVRPGAGGAGGEFL